MKPNVGASDAMIRWTLAFVFFGMAVVFNSSAVIALLSALVALVMAGTALTRVCPLYTASGIDTARRRTTPHATEKPAR